MSDRGLVNDNILSAYGWPDADILSELDWNEAETETAQKRAQLVFDT